MPRPETHDADTSRFLDERGSTSALAPNGLNPATIMEKAVRDRIVNSMFFQDRCFGVNEADVVDRVVEHVDCVGGTYGVTQKPTAFLCLAFKLLQLAPTEEVLQEYLGYGGEKFKYLRALALFYVRLTRQAKECYEVLEPYLEDRRKLMRRGRNGKTLVHMDEFVDDLLHKDRVCGTSLNKIPKRYMLEDLEVLEPRVSPLGDVDDLLDEDDEEGDKENGKEESDRGEDRQGSEEGEEMDVDRGETPRSPEDSD